MFTIGMGAAALFCGRDDIAASWFPSPLYGRGRDLYHHPLSTVSDDAIDPAGRRRCPETWFPGFG